MSTYTPIATQILTSNTASITFASIPTNYTDLVLVIDAISGNSTSNLRLRFNNDTGGNYSSTFMYGFPSSVYGDRQTNETYILIGAMYNTRSTHIINIQNYNNPNVFKNTLTRTGASAEGTGALIGLWRNTAPITSINITDAQGFNVGAGSTFNLYGIASGGGYALGGDIVTTDGTYWYHAFLSSGAFIPTQELTADVLVVAGGGSGGGDSGGGGGAGGLLGYSSQTLTTNPYNVIVGAGGVFPGGATLGINGNNSQFGSLTASVGGGAGGGGGTDPKSINRGRNGGSGGGGGGRRLSGVPASGGTGTSGQGNNGGTSNGLDGSDYADGGGGGAVSAGGNASGGGIGGNGGAGSSTYSSWGSATSTGQNSSGTFYYAGGGGGEGATTAGTGGLGGGGNSGSAGSRSTGGGGGAGGNGGSGIVIVRYAV